MADVASIWVFFKFIMLFFIGKRMFLRGRERERVRERVRMRGDETR